MRVVMIRPTGVVMVLMMEAVMIMVLRCDDRELGGTWSLKLV